MLTKITIGCYDYTIKKVKDKPILDGEEAVGLITFGDRLIQIYSGADRDEQSMEQTLWHEIVHAILNYRNIPDDDETMVDAIASTLYGICKKHPKLPGQR